MADFLSNLLDRTFGYAPVLQKRRASRFELNATPTPELVESTSENKPRPAAPLILGADDRRHAEHPGSAENTGAEGKVPGQPARIPEVSDAIHPIRKATPELQTTALEGQMSRTTAPPPIQHEIHESIVERRTLERVEYHRETRVEREVVQKTFSHHHEAERVTPTVSATPDVAEQKPSRIVDPQPVVVSQQRPSLNLTAVPLASDSRELPRRAESPFSEPPGLPASIQVTIGRIEVRAASSPSLPRREPRAPARPRLTLDQYLETRQKDRA